MARIVIIRHELEPADFSHFALSMVAEKWSADGHEVQVVSGILDLPDGDVAILHVDLTVVPAAYGKAARAYPRVVNGSALDISKRLVSRHLITRDSPWTGPVIVKSDLNFGGWPEWQMRKRAIALGKPVPNFPKPQFPTLYRRMSIVPEDTWARPDVVVERFVPEFDKGIFSIRHWMFFGDRERCKRCMSREPVIKGANVFDAEDAPIPDEMRAERRRLRLDYGKLDFVIHKGRPILLDANKTPGQLPGTAKGGFPEYLAGAIDAMLAEPAVAR